MFGIQITCNYCTRRHNGDLSALKRIKELHGADFIKDGKVMMQLRYTGEHFYAKCKICGQAVALRVDKEKFMATGRPRIIDDRLRFRHDMTKVIR